MSCEFRDELLQSYSDAELIRHIDASPKAESEEESPWPFRIGLLSENLVSKIYKARDLPDETRGHEVARRLGIRVPNILRTVTDGRWAYCIIERIHGPTLREAWKELGWFTTVRLALQLRRFVRLLRSVTSTTAGSLVTGRWSSFYLDDLFGLPDRSSSENVVAVLQFWARFKSFKDEVRASRQSRSRSAPRIPPTASTFVLTHHDLAPRNLILAPSGQLWLLDWDFAGFYPIYFEYAGMQNFVKPRNWGRVERWRWALFCWISVGRYEQHRLLLSRIDSKILRCGTGRRFELLKNGGPSRRPVS